MSGSQAGRLTSALLGINPLGAHARFSASMDEHQVAPNTCYNSSPLSSGPHTAANANSTAPQVPPTLRPIFFGNYISEAGLSQPYLLGLPESRPSPYREPAGTVLTTTAIDSQAQVLHQQALGMQPLLIVYMG